MKHLSEGGSMRYKLGDAVFTKSPGDTFFISWVDHDFIEATAHQLITMGATVLEESEEIEELPIVRYLSSKPVAIPTIGELSLKINQLIRAVNQLLKENHA